MAKSKRNKLAGRHLVSNANASPSTIYYRKNPNAKAKKDNYNTSYEDKPDQVKNRENRNKANKSLNPPKGYDVDHKDGNPKNNSKENLQVIKASKNRAKKKPNKWWKKNKKR